MSAALVVDPVPLSAGQLRRERESSEILRVIFICNPPVPTRKRNSCLRKGSWESHRGKPYQFAPAALRMPVHAHRLV
jgi:hypothetical protein